MGGGAGMAPILPISLDRGKATSARGLLLWRARPAICSTRPSSPTRQRLPNFRFMPALSDWSDPDWDGEGGMITDVVERLSRS